jgi:hypothetical protein
MGYEVDTNLRGKLKNYHLESTPNLFIGNFERVASSTELNTLQLYSRKNQLHQQTGVLLLPIIAIAIYYTHYGTIIRYYGAIIAIVVLQMSRLLFFINALSPKRLLLHLWQYYYFTYCFGQIYYCYYCYYHTIIYIIVNTHYYDYYGF